MQITYPRSGFGIGRNLQRTQCVIIENRMTNEWLLLYVWFECMWGFEFKLTAKEQATKDKVEHEVDDKVLGLKLFKLYLYIYVYT